MEKSDSFFTFVGIAIGGDVFPGSTLSDHVLRYNNIPQVILLYMNCFINILKRFRFNISKI